MDEVSNRRLSAYQQLLDDAAGLTDLIDSARAIFSQDLDSGHVAVLVEMITGAHSMPGLGEQVAERLAPWRTFADAAARRALAGSPIELLLPAEQVGHAIVAGFLGLELLADLDGDREPALVLFDRVRLIASLLDLTADPFGTEQSREEG